MFVSVFFAYIWYLLYNKEDNLFINRKETFNEKYLGPIIVVVAVIVIIGLFMIGPYNRLVGLEEEADKSLSNIDNQLQRRVDLIPNLVDTVKGYTKHEEKVFKDVSDARSKLAGANTPEEKQKQMEKLIVR